jgi:hypothetical protein
VHVVEGVIAAACVLSILIFLIYLFGLSHLPGSGRPKTPTMNRFGEPLSPSENPGYQETEDEKE